MSVRLCAPALLLAFVACAPKPFVGRVEALRAAPHLCILGADFSHSRFNDPMLEFDDLRARKIPAWSRAIATELRSGRWERAELDLALTGSRNGALAATALEEGVQYDPQVVTA